jgi:hypothetical protein
VGIMYEAERIQMCTMCRIASYTQNMNKVEEVFNLNYHGKLY